MSTLPKLKVSVRLGASADIALRLETNDLRFAEITGMTKSAPLEVTSIAHGILDQWYVAVVDVKGMTELNAEDSQNIKKSEFHQVTVVDVDTLEFNGISSAGFHSYSSGGYLAYYAPLDLSGYTGARMDVKRVVGGQVELALNTSGGTLDIDPSTSTVWIKVAESDLTGLTPRDYVFDIELLRSNGIDAICSSDSIFEVLSEVTTST